MRRGIPIAPRECWGKKAVLKPAKSTQNWSLPSRSSRSRPDRKSTRLNSSHSQISYAVFCLKKKKKHNRHLNHIAERYLANNSFTYHRSQTYEPAYRYPQQHIEQLPNYSLVHLPPHILSADY